MAVDGEISIGSGPPGTGHSIVGRAGRPIKFPPHPPFAAEATRDWQLFLAAFDHKSAISQDFADLSRVRAVAFAVRIWHRSAVAGDIKATTPKDAGVAQG